MTCWSTADYLFCWNTYAYCLYSSKGSVDHGGLGGARSMHKLCPTGLLSSACTCCGTFLAVVCGLCQLSDFPHSCGSPRRLSLIHEVAFSIGWSCRCRCSCHSIHGAGEPYEGQQQSPLEGPCYIFRVSFPAFLMPSSSLSL